MGPCEKSLPLFALCIAQVVFRTDPGREWGFSTGSAHRPAATYTSCADGYLCIASQTIAGCGQLEPTQNSPQNTKLLMHFERRGIEAIPLIDYRATRVMYATYPAPAARNSRLALVTRAMRPGSAWQPISGAFPAAPPGRDW